jgi:hypothetical protein
MATDSRRTPKPVFTHPKGDLSYGPFSLTDSPPLQVLLQINAGIEPRVPLLVTKAATFWVLGFLAGFLKVRLYGSMPSSNAAT